MERCSSLIHHEIGQMGLFLPNGFRHVDGGVGVEERKVYVWWIV